jgi:hypothetical protein
VSFEIPSANKIPEGFSAIGGLFVEFSAGSQPLDGLFVVDRPLGTLRMLSCFSSLMMNNWYVLDGWMDGWMMVCFLMNGWDAQE